MYEKKNIISQNNSSSKVYALLSHNLFLSFKSYQIQIRVRKKTDRIQVARYLAITNIST